MKKTYPHTVLSDRHCSHPGCNKRIKQRLTETKKNIHLCYEHHCQKEANRGHTINSKSRLSRVEAGLSVKNYQGGKNENKIHI